MSALADRIELEADDYLSDSCGMTDAEGELYDKGWYAGMKRAAEIVREHES